MKATRGRQLCDMALGKSSINVEDEENTSNLCATENGGRNTEDSCEIIMQVPNDHDFYSLPPVGNEVIVQDESNYLEDMENIMLPSTSSGGESKYTAISNEIETMTLPSTSPVGENELTTKSNLISALSSDSELDEDEDFIPNSQEYSTDSSQERRSRSRVRRQVIISESEMSDSDSPIKKKKGRKRVQNKENWKCNIRKRKILSAQTYISKRGKTVEEKKVGPSCSPCRLNCSQKISSANREEIFKKFWNLNMTWDKKRQFILTTVKQHSVERRRTSNVSFKRNSTNSYSLILNKDPIKVCKKFYLRTLAISETIVRNSLKKAEHGIIQEDRRGRHEPSNKISDDKKESIRNHIKMFPKYQSHYSRERTSREYLGSHLNIEKMYELYVSHMKSLTQNIRNEDIPKNWLYRKIFNEEFNLGFSMPANDTCDDCDRYVIKLREIQNMNEKSEVEKEYEEHLKESADRYDLKRKDKTSAKLNDQHEKLITVDLQKCLPTPFLTNGQSFYLRKLWTFNYTISDSTTNENFCVMWDETKAGRGGNELSSGLLKWFELHVKDKNIKELTIWSDNCPGQNKNINIIATYLWLLHKYNLEIINHKYLLKGHTHMEVDGIHSIIEREKKKQPQFSIMTPWDWEQLVKMSSSDKNKIHVVHMDTEDFKKISDLFEGTNSPFIHRKKSVEGETVPYSSIVWMRLEKNNYGTLKYKTSFSQEDFKQVVLYRNIRKGIENMEKFSGFTPLRTTQKPLKTNKYKDLMTALQWIPSMFHDYYRNIPHGENIKDDD